MIHKSRLIASATTVAALGLAMLAGPSGADTSTIDLTVTAGALSVDAPATISGSGGLGSDPQLTVSGIAVDDDRGSLAGWTVTVTSTDLTTGGGDDPGETIPASDLTWTTTAITPNDGQVGIAIPTAGALDGSATAAVGLPLVSPGSYTLNGTIDVNMSNTNVAGSYAGTLTTSVS